VNVDIFSDANILLTLIFRQPSFLGACEKFKEDARVEKLQVLITSSVKDVCDRKISGINDLVGRVVRGLAIHISTIRTGGNDFLLEKTTLTDQDRSLIRRFFSSQYSRAQSELEKSHYRATEAWVVAAFDAMLREQGGSLEMIEFLRKLLMRNQEEYTKISTNYQAVLNELNSKPVPIVPSSAAKSSVSALGVTDNEDIPHLASVVDHVNLRSLRAAVFVTTDYVHLLSNTNLQNLKIYCEEPTWAVHTYKALLQGRPPP
jgi:hypothetical protein